MRFPLSWLKEYISINRSPQAIAKILTMAGLEVESMETVLPSFSDVVVGKVLTVEKHPNADKLCVATVTDGKESYQVVCGAPNCRTGLKTAFARVGATLQDDGGKEFKVKKTKIRGVESSGMLCSTKELKLGDDQDGILEFEEEMSIGVDLAELHSDIIFEIGLTPNLGHCANLIGIARELSAATEEPIRYPEITLKEDHQVITELADVKVKDFAKCPRYACRVVKDVTLGPSPYWIQSRLIACGLRPINNVVDITNYVLLEMGQPLHAFDYDRLEGHQIVVRGAAEGERFITLDEKERLLTSQDLLICDQAKGVALAGVMGGRNSEVSNTTQNVLIESAYFQPSTIRKTSKRLGLQTDSSRRFERGCDPNQVLRSLDRAAMLMQRIAGGKVVKGVIDVKEHDFPEKTIHCRLNRINQILGTHLGISEVEGIFQRLGMPCKWDGQVAFSIKVPTYRADIQGEIDLIEEVGRVYGFDNITRAPSYYQSSSIPHTPLFLFEREMRSRLIAEGLQEFLTCDLIGPAQAEIVQDTIMPRDFTIQVLNPVSIEQSVLRTSLLPGLLNLVKYNFDHQNHQIGGFEVGRVHFKEGNQYKEQPVVGIVLTGHSQPHAWDQKSRDYDFYDLKGIIENVLREIGIEDFSFKPGTLSIFHSGRQAAIYVGSLEVGSMGEVHPTIQRKLDVPQRILFAELNLQDLFQVRQLGIKMKPLPIYPSSTRDWTVSLSEEIPIQDVFAMIHKSSSSLLEEVSLVDIYRSEKLGKNVKNVTFHFVYRDKEKTISQEAVDAEHARLTTDSLNTIKNLG
jgi:phenylalanyl-tRNA synthetase beta chain